MNHRDCYMRLMQSRQQLRRKKTNDGMLEEHHIQPLSLGGSDDPLNRVVLTTREHFVAHLLLVRFVRGKDKAKMAYALLMMTRRNPGQTRIVTAWQYAMVKRLVAKNASGKNHPMFGRQIWSLEQRSEISERMSGARNHRYGKKPWNSGLTASSSSALRGTSDKVRRYWATHGHPTLGRAHTADAKKKIGDTHRGKHKTAEHRASLSAALKGRPPMRSGIEKSAAQKRGVQQPRATCPHCGATGGRVAMMRWHFDSCRNNHANK